MTHFNKTADQWDTLEKIILNEQYSKRIKSLIPHNKMSKILDFGCGTGLLISNFQNEENILIGVDTSEGMLEVFNNKFKNLKNTKSYLLNLEENDLNEGQFDLIVSTMTFHHLKQPDQMIKKLKKMLASDGVIAIIDLDQEDGSFHPDPANMGVFHFGFSNEMTNTWADQVKLERPHREIIHTINKNNKSYPVFLAIFSNNLL